VFLVLVESTPYVLELFALPCRLNGSMVSVLLAIHQTAGSLECVSCGCYGVVGFDTVVLASGHQLFKVFCDGLVCFRTRMLSVPAHVGHLVPIFDDGM